ncbi:hypothetical protein B0T26DRAFT_349074 [Lasiosphaeria miniovina]|uniref:Uncharacterized protein n=1 Tax=Lasiosphaeria miniovina TaxID=1954250 RepID=A0AA40ABS2_9PEZI|nr:uncharacterized protein B0T26DRAFT_349074 [Lasiosphaeria miniovina]KAK0712931.1 hypothetical protein B0T26DRAFT_349074 [Lasiosphaeria miniovina]
MDQQRGAALAERDLPLFGLEDALDPLSPPAWTGPFLPDDYCGGYTPTTPYYATTQPLDIFGTLDNIFPSPCPPQQQFLHTDPTLSPAPVTAYNDNQLAVTTSPSLASSFSIDPQQGFAYSYTQRHWTQWPDTTETKSTARLDTAKIQTTSPLNDKSHMRRRQAPAAAHSHTSQKARGRGKHGRATGVPSTPVATFAATPPIAAAHGPWRPLTVGEAGEGEAPEVRVEPVSALNLMNSRRC